MTYVILSLITVSLASLSTVFYRSVNNGISSSSKHQQLTRLSVASLIAMLPWLAIGEVPSGAAPVFMGATSLFWAITYPLLYHLSNRRTLSEYDNQMDIAFGLYLFGLMSALHIALASVPELSAWIIGFIEAVLLVLILAQWVYYFIYKEVISFDGMTVVQGTDVNEVFEFVKSFNPFGVAIVILLLIGVIIAPFALNLSTLAIAAHLPIWIVLVEATIVLALIGLIFVGRKSPVRRCGIVALYLNILDYRKKNSQYAANAELRRKSLKVSSSLTDDLSPRTIVLVIGESANRDFMSAFTELDRETTPWMSEIKKSENAILFPNAYSSAMVTVNSLQRALTESNQYNDKEFFDSVSIIDIAHKLGYKVHWYSNQGHIGAFDTPMTLIADTADVARWTDQQLNQASYDESLLDFLCEVDGSRNNLVVLHLMGSHFNFSSRYPANRKVWSPKSRENKNVINYLNSICYTDDVLRRIYEYAVGNLNLDAMVYFSDHATYPDRTRTPGFMGFGMTRIPLFVWLSDRYRENLPERAKALRCNAEKYFTNDLVYELMCGVLDVTSDNFDESNSLASDKYKFTRDMLLTYDGTIRIADDHTDERK